MRRTTDTPAARSWLVALAFAAVASACCGARSYRGGPALDVRGYPPDIQHAYVVFAANCSKCHGLSRPLNARIRDVAYWDLYVARMRRMPGSGISAREVPAILTFLYYYTDEVKGDAAGGAGSLPVEPPPDPPAQEPPP